MARSKNADSERVNKETLSHVIAMLEGDKPWTKKACCEYLNIAYNTTRLSKLIEDFKERQAYAEDQRKKKRGTAAKPDEISYAITSYLVDRASVTSIAESLFRSVAFVNNILQRYGVPKIPTSHDYHNPELIPEEASRLEFDINEIVYSARYNCMATIKEEVENHSLHGKIYKVWLHEPQNQYARSAAYDLASLRHLKDLGVNIE